MAVFLTTIEKMALGDRRNADLVRFLCHESYRLLVCKSCLPATMHPKDCQDCLSIMKEQQVPPLLVAVNEVHAMTANCLLTAQLLRLRPPWVRALNGETLHFEHMVKHARKARKPEIEQILLGILGKFKQEEGLDHSLIVAYSKKSLYLYRGILILE